MLRKVAPSAEKANESLNLAASYLDEARQAAGLVARRISLAGAYMAWFHAAREEQGEGSDIDVLVEFGPGTDLFDFVGLSQYLEEKVGSGVDVVPEAALRPEIRRQVTRDLLFA
ncbi:hypothetical protein ES707_08857 [subsurface metagenome]